MRRLVLFLAASALPLLAANLKMYLKDGSYQIVREYTVDSDRVKFYSVERSEWEEMPADLVDLKRTEADLAERKAIEEKQAKAVDDEDAAAKAIRDEIRKIPRDPGVYRLENGELHIFPLADWKVHNSKGRTALKILTPIGKALSGKSTMEIPGEHSQNVVHEDRPEFYLQLAETESFAIAKVTPDKGVRIVEKLTTDLANQTTEERQSIDIFSKQLTESGLYKVWPQNAMEKGEYVLMEYADGQLNQRIWDFRIE